MSFIEKILNKLKSIPFDKLLHYNCGDSIAIIMFMIMCLIGLNWVWSSLISLAVVFGFALWKEKRDSTGKGSVELMDVAATVIGGIKGVIVCLIMLLF